MFLIKGREKENVKEWTQLIKGESVIEKESGCLIKGGKRACLKEKKNISVISGRKSEWVG